MRHQDLKTVLDAKLDELTSRRTPRETTALISDALKRMETGTYGICAECAVPISPRRLAALPWARFCIGCQDAHDRETCERAA